MQKFVPRSHVVIFFPTNAPDPPHWTLNSCLCASRSVWVYFAIFCYYTKLGAKGLNWWNIAQDRATKSHRNFPQMNGPDPPHWTIKSCFGVFHSVWVHLGSFRNSMKLDAKQGELVQLKQKVRDTRSRRDFSQRTHPICPIRPETHVLVHCIVFGCIWDLFVTAWNSMQNSVNWCS